MHEQADPPTTLEGWLRLVERAPVPRSVADLRAATALMAPRQNAGSPLVTGPVRERVRLHEVADAAGRNAHVIADVIEPPAQPHDRDTPTLVYFHGGGFVTGSPRDYARLLRHWARRGFRVVAPWYPLAPEHPWTQIMASAPSAVTAAAGTFPAGPIVVAGDSAGALLALYALHVLRPMPAPTGTPPPGVRVRAAALLYGWFDPFTPTPGEWPGLALMRAACVESLRGGAPPGPAWMQAVDPRTPMLLVAAGEDALRGQSLEAARHLSAAGAALRLMDVPAVPHGFLQQDLWPATGPTLDAAAEFLHNATRG